MTAEQSLSPFWSLSLFLFFRFLNDDVIEMSEKDSQKNCIHHTSSSSIPIMTMRMRMMMKGPQLLSTIALLSAVRPHHRSSSLLASAFFTSRVSHHHTIRMMASSTTTTTSNINQTQILQDALYRIRDVNHVPPHIRESLIPFCVDGRVVGQVKGYQ